MNITRKIFLLHLLPLLFFSCTKTDQSKTPLLLAFFLLQSPDIQQTSEIPQSPTEIKIQDTPATEGVFDASPVSDSSGNLWMSYSSVTISSNDSVIPQVRSRIARSQDQGATWADIGVDPNGMVNADLQIPYSSTTTWATWSFEVSDLLYDPYDSDNSRRYKIMWHRYLTADINGTATRIFTLGWVGLSTAPSPSGPWAIERKLFTGSIYDAAGGNGFLGAPEFPLNTLDPALNGCTTFTEPGMLAKVDGIYVSLQCTGSPEKVILLKCDRSFSSCTYKGDLLQDNQASHYTVDGQNLTGFAATHLTSSNSGDFLIVSPYEPPADLYRGCLVFPIGDLSAASLKESGGFPDLKIRISGNAGSFNGACGYDRAGSASGIIYGEVSDASPYFHLFASHINL
jgi:hypothetical protein